MATYDIQKSVGKNRNQSAKGDVIKTRVDFSKINNGAGAAAADVIVFRKTPKNFVLESAVAVLRTAKGSAGTIDIGTAAAPNGLLNDGNTNGTVNATIAKAGTEAGLPAGTMLSETNLQILCNAAHALGVVDVYVKGFIAD